MISTEEALEYLFDDANYNFRDFLQDVSCGESQENAQVLLIINTVEVFAFGNLSHYTKYKEKLIELPPRGIEKLMKLTLVSFCNEHEGGSVSFDVLINALLPYIGEPYIEESEDKLERLLVSMVDGKVLSALIDEKHRRVFFSASHLQRDAYNPSTYKLRVLSESDVSKVSAARDILQQWVDEHIAPARQRLQQA